MLKLFKFGKNYTNEQTIHSATPTGLAIDLCPKPYDYRRFNFMSELNGNNDYPAL